MQQDNLNFEDQNVHQYQQNEQSFPHFMSLNTNKTMLYGIENKVSRLG